MDLKPYLASVILTELANDLPKVLIVGQKDASESMPARRLAQRSGRRTSGVGSSGRQRRRISAAASKLHGLKTNQVV